MKRENIAKTVSIILATLFFIVVGSCFSAFLYKYEMVEVEDPNIILAEGMQAFNSKGDKVITTLNLSKMPLGLKPATGDEDADTNIPATVTDKQGSEGLYASFKVFAPSGVIIKIKDIEFQTNQDRETIDNERENIFVAVKEIEESAKSLEEDEVVLGTINASDERQALTFYVWLSAKTGTTFKSVKISFNLYFELIA